MRILKLEFENLNSLKGFWSIDFTNPDYAKNHDIFVICGPTGAGKTTILDAITLGLYGRTPRLEAINNGEGGNEIMTRGTGFCRVQVTYSCKNGVFTSEFQQNRANMKSGGNLQKASFKITNCDTKEVCASGVASNLGKETQKIIQLDYKQFCRSIMLAQGEFSAFLESSPRERAEILEKLTGTERYRKIAKSIAEKFSEIKKAFALKKTEKDEIENLILEPHAEKEAEAQQEEFSKKIERIGLQLEQLGKELSFYEELERLEKSLASAKKEKETVFLEVQEFSTEEKRLVLAQSARNVEAEYIKLKNLRTIQQKDKTEFTAVVKKIKESEGSYNQAKENLECIKKELAEQEKACAAQQVIWKKVRSLDVQISSASETLKNLSDRKENDKKLIEQNNQKKIELEKELGELRKKINSENEYIKANSADKNLPGVIAKLEALSQNVQAQLKNAAEINEKKLELTKVLSETQSELAKNEKKLKNLENEITKFISSDAIFISKLLQLQLKEGNPCPVCGSIYHKKHSEMQGEIQRELDLFGENEFESKSQKISKESANLNAQREELEVLCQKLSARIQALESDLRNGEKNSSAAEKALEENTLQIKEAVSSWQSDFDIKALDILLQDLRQKSEIWENKESLCKEFENSESAKAAQLKALLENTEVQKNQFEALALEFNNAQTAFNKIKAEREKLFGSKSADEEELKKNQLIEELKKKSEEAESLQQESAEEKTRLETLKSRLEKTVLDRESELDFAEKEFAEKCSLNSFGSEQEFADARMEIQEFEALTKKSESLKTRKTQAETSLKNAEKSYSDFKESAKVNRSKDEAQKQKDQLSLEKEELGEKLIEIKAKLQMNRQNCQRAQKILLEYNTLQSDFALWEQMDKWIGKSDGSDVSVFVQSLAFNSLLNLANNNLFGITGRYRLVQKDRASLEFEIQDIYFEGNRSVENLSGGEKFLVSLSFALAISEFASRNVRVDSLFLDEGFGTLSGELLTEAINALKNLQKDGKMLGIITHVQDVINEIDQKIEVKPVSGGHSILIGSGIQTKNQK